MIRAGGRGRVFTRGLSRQCAGIQWLHFRCFFQLGVVTFGFCPYPPGPIPAGRLDHLISARTVSDRDVSSLTAPVARSRPMRAPHAEHRQLAQMPTGRSDGCCRPRRSVPGHPDRPPSASARSE